MNRIKILLIDNHPEVLKRVKTRLSYEPDFEVCKVASIDAVTESMIECKPDILLIDPADNNIIQIEPIKIAKRLLPSLIVIVLTAVVDTATSVALRKAGAETILEKGIVSEELVNTLRKYNPQNVAQRE